MSTDLEFNKNEVVAGSNVYAVERVSGPSIAEVEPGDTITFKRSGQDEAMGFTVSFEGENAPGTMTVPQGQKTATLTAPEVEKSVTWKYVVAFPNDASKGDTVVDLDPIIVINPGISSSRGSLRDLAVFVGGAIVAYLAVRFFPGMLG